MVEAGEAGAPRRAAGTDGAAEPRRARAWAALLCALAAAWLWSARPDGRDGRFEIDEAEWLTMSIHDALQVTAGRSPFEGIPPSPYRDADGDPWEVGIHQSTFGSMNPMLPKLAFGGLCLALGHRAADPAVYPRFAKELPPGRAARAEELVRPALLPVRLLVLGLASLCAGLVFLAALRAGGPAAGIAAWLLFLASPNVVDHATRIRTDFFPIACGLGALVLAQRRGAELAGERGTGALLRAAGALGVLAGLAVGSKLNGALVALCIGLWIPLARLRADRAAGFGRGGSARGTLAGWLAAAVPCLALFALFSPHLWTEPLASFTDLLARWSGDLEHQKDLYGERLGRADTPLQHLALSARGVAGEHEPLFALTGLPLGVPLLVLGLAALALGRPRAAGAALLAYLLVQGLGTALWLPFGRDNFYLGFAPVVALAEGAALGLLAALAARRVRR